MHTDVFCFWLQIHALKMPSGKIHFYAQSESEEEGRRSASTSLRCVLSVRISWRYSKTKSCRQNETFRERHSVVKNKHVCKLDNLCYSFCNKLVAAKHLFRKRRIRSIFPTQLAAAQTRPAFDEVLRQRINPPRTEHLASGTEHRRNRTDAKHD